LQLQVGEWRAPEEGGMRNRPAAREAAVTYLEHAGGREVDVDGEDAHALGLRRHLSLSLSLSSRRRPPPEPKKLSCDGRARDRRQHASG
jgi:hypothetical protein